MLFLARELVSSETTKRGGSCRSKCEELNATEVSLIFALQVQPGIA